MSVYAVVFRAGLVVDGIVVATGTYYGRARTNSHQEETIQYYCLASPSTNTITL